MKKNVTKVVSGFAAFAGVASLCMTTSFADTTTTTTTTANTSFETRFQTNVQAEQTLWAQLSTTASTDTNVVALEAAVQAIDTQVTALNTSELTLFATQTNIPRPDPSKSSLAKMDAQRNNLEVLMKAEWNAAKKDHGKKDHGKNDKNMTYNDEMSKYKQFEKQFDSLQTQINLTTKEFGTENREITNAKPYADGLLALKTSILDLQFSAMTYTKEAIALQKSDAAAASATTTTTTTSTTPASTTPGTTTTGASTTSTTSTSSTN
jgi:hypothetical protein